VRSALEIQLIFSESSSHNSQQVEGKLKFNNQWSFQPKTPSVVLINAVMHQVQLGAPDADKDGHASSALKKVMYRVR
jgi:hypothetical protein